MMRSDLLLCGVGGQGTVLASRLLAQAAVMEGIPVRTAETIGMAQRGGSVTSHVRLGDGVYSSMVPLHGADMLIAFEPAEAVRNLEYLREGGTLVVSTYPVFPVSGCYDTEKILAFLKEKTDKLMLVDARAICEKCGTYKVLNTVLLGAASQSTAFPFSRKDISRAVSVCMPERIRGINITALGLAANEGETKRELFF